MLNFSTVGCANVKAAPGVEVPSDIAARYRSWREVGRSASGHRLFHVHDGRLNDVVFVKWIDRSAGPDAVTGEADASSQARHRTRIQQVCKHPRLVGVHQAISTSKWWMSSSPLLQGGSLIDVLHQRTDRSWRETDAATVVRSVLQGLAVLHNEGLRFGSVTPHDILYADASAPLSSLKLKIGRGTHAIEEANAVSDRSSVYVASTGKWFLSTDVMAPEEVFHVIGHFGGSDEEPPRISTAADMWSVGLLAFWLMTGSTPWPAAHKTNNRFLWFRRIASGGYHSHDANDHPLLQWPSPDLTPEAIAACDPQERTYRTMLLARGSPFRDVLDFIAKCCKRRPAERLTAAEALLHPWLNASETQDRPVCTLDALVGPRRSVTSSGAYLSGPPSRPEAQGRFSVLLQQYIGLTSSSRLKANSAVCALWCAPGSWQGRRCLLVDLRGPRCGGVGCGAVLRAVFAAIRLQHPKTAESTSDLGTQLPSIAGPPPLILTGIDVSDNDLSDAAVAFMAELLSQHVDLLSHLQCIRLSHNSSVTHAGARELLRFLAVFEKYFAASSGRPPAALKAVDWTGCHVSDKLSWQRDKFLAAISRQ